MHSDGRFLLDLVDRMGPRQSYFLVWLGITLFFCALMVSYYRRTVRTQFRPRGKEKEPKAVVPRSGKDIKPF